MTARTPEERAREIIQELPHTLGEGTTFDSVHVSIPILTEKLTTALREAEQRGWKAGMLKAAEIVGGMKYEKTDGHHNALADSEAIGWNDCCEVAVGEIRSAAERGEA